MNTEKQSNLNPTSLSYSQLLDFIEYWERRGYSSKQILTFIKDSCKAHMN